MEEETKTFPESFSPPVGELAASDDDDNTVVICNGNEKTNDGTEDGVESKTETVPAEEQPQMFLLSNNGTLCLEFLEDQGREDNFTDLDLICCDGFIQVHRCLLMGASKFLRDLLIEKDIMDTTAITLPDITVRHLRQALGLLYTGKTLIQECDEVEVFKTMNVLGLPVSSLLCRTAKINDTSQIAVLRHNLSDDGICVNEVSEDEDMEKQGETDMVANQVLDTGDEDIQENVELDKCTKLTSEVLEPMQTSDVGNDEDILQQITSTTGDSDSPNDFIPPTQDGSSTAMTGTLKPEEPLEETKKDSDQYKLQTDHNLSPELSKSTTESNETNNVVLATNADEKIVTDQDSQLNNSSLSVISDQEDLSFEAACNDLQKQVAKPTQDTDTDKTVPNASPTTGHEMKLRKRKTNDADDESKPATDEKLGTRSVGKKKKTAAKRGKNRNATNGTNSDGGNESDIDKPADVNKVGENSKEKFPTTAYGTKTGKSDPTSQQRRLSTCSSTTDSNGTAAAPFTRVFLEMKEFNGIKYNIYGFMDSEKGIQSGKTIAIMTSKDKSTNVRI